MKFHRNAYLILTAIYILAGLGTAIGRLWVTDFNPQYDAINIVYLIGCEILFIHAVISFVLAYNVQQKIDKLRREEAEKAYLTARFGGSKPQKGQLG